MIIVVVALAQWQCKKNVSLTQISEGCNYSYNAVSTNIKWTAYKFTSKIGVKGKFDKHTAKLQQSAPSIAKSLTGLAFELETSSINSGNAGRDEKLKKILNMVNTNNGRSSNNFM